MKTKRFFRGCCTLLAACFLALASADAQGQQAGDQAKLDAAFKKGQELSKAGKHAEAIAQFQIVVELAPKVNGANSTNEAAYLGYLAIAYQDAGQHAKAEPLFQRSLNLYEKNLGKDHPDVAIGLSNLAALYQRMGQHAKAEPLFLRSLQIDEAKLGKDHPQVATSLYTLAELCRSMDQHAKAEPLFQRCLAIQEAKLGKDHLNVAHSLAGLALAYESMSQYAKAEPLCQRSLQIYEAKLGKDHPQVASALGNLASLYRSMGQYAKAEPLLQRSLQINETKLGKDHPQVAYTLFDLGWLHASLGEYAKAEQSYQRSLSIREAKLGKDHLDVANCLNGLGQASESMGQYAKAEPLFQRSLEIYEAKRGKDHPDVATGLNNLASLYHTMGRYAKAEQLHQRSLAIREAKLGKDDLQVAISLGNLAGLYRSMGQYGKAEPLFLRSLQIYEAKLGKDHPEVANSLNSLGVIYWSMGQYAKAEPLYQRGLEIREAKLGKDHPDLASSLHNQASLCVMTGQYAKAEPLYLRSLQILEAKLGKDHPNVGKVLGRLGSLYQALGQYPKAESIHQRSLHLREAHLGKDHPDVASSLNDLATLYKTMGQYAKAEPLFERSIEIYRARLGRDHPDTVKAMSGLAELLVFQDRIGEAIRLVDRCQRSLQQHTATVLPIMSEAEQLAFLHRFQQEKLHAGLSLGLERQLGEENRHRLAAWLLNGKALAQQSLAERLLLARDNQSAEARQLLAELADVSRELSRLSLTAADQKRRDELAQKEKELSTQLHVADHRQARAESWVELDDVRQRLPAGSAFIDVVRLQGRGKQKEALPPARYVAWITPARGDVQVVDLGSADKIDEAVAALRQAMGDSQKTIASQGEIEAEKTLRQPLQALAGLVLQPLRQHIDSAETWVLSPDGSLWLVPWAALPLDDRSYVVEKHRVSYVVSGRDLVLNPLRLDQQSGPPLVFADPDFNLSAERAGVAPRPLPGGDLLRSLPDSLPLGKVARLPGTAAEAKSVTPALAKYAGAAPRVLTDDQALAGAFLKAKGPRVLILATHGYFLPDQQVKPTPSDAGDTTVPKVLPGYEDPLLRCGLLLAGCNHARSAKPGGETGVLTGREIVSTDLRGTELVVLSACETGLGQIRNGEGVAGLRQAFQLAGARSVLATLWQIPDIETARLMSDLFGQLADKKGQAEALREAQLAMIKARRDRNGAAHPFFWAAFTLTGQ